MKARLLVTAACLLSACSNVDDHGRVRYGDMVCDPAVGNAPRNCYTAPTLRQQLRIERWELRQKQERERAAADRKTSPEHLPNPTKRKGPQ